MTLEETYKYKYLLFDDLLNSDTYRLKLKDSLSRFYFSLFILI